MLFYQYYYYYVVLYMYFQMGIIDLFAITDTQSFTYKKISFTSPSPPKNKPLFTSSVSYHATIKQHSKNTPKINITTFGYGIKHSKFMGMHNKSVFKICQMFTHFPRTITICLGTLLPHSHIFKPPTIPSP